MQSFLSSRSFSGSLLLPLFLCTVPVLRAETHHYDLRDPELAAAAQRYDLAQEGNGKPFQQKARFADIWHKGEKGWQIVFTR